MSYLMPYAGVFLILVMIFSGRAFRDNWKIRKKNWVMNSWIFGLIFMGSFISIINIPI